MAALAHQLPGFLLDVLRLSVWLFLLMIVFVPLERLFGLRAQQIFRKSFGLDLGYYFMAGILPKMLLVVPVALVAEACRWIVPHPFQSFMGGLPASARMAAALVVSEAGFYWGHRWTHEIPFLWRFHAIHHSAEELDWLVNTRAHPLDTVFTRLCGLAPLYALGLARPAAGLKLDPAPLVILLAATMWGFFIHSNLRWRLGWVSWLISTPAFHHWHHSNDENNKNYASMLPLMDRLFGTWHMPRQWPAQYGIEQRVAPGLIAQLVDPFAGPFAPGNQPEPADAAQPREA
jgi:sterol desaturase/sphingolipid hydroxylase (fatty acid hydroxylase superfamily)